MIKRYLKFVLVAFLAGIVSGCTEQHVVLADMTSDQRIVQVTAEGFFENYSVHIVLRDNSGNVLHQQKIVGNLDQPGDMKDYVAYVHQRGEAIEIGVLDDAYVQELDSGFGSRVLMCRYSDSEYKRLVGNPALISTFSSQCRSNNSFNPMPLRGTG